MRLRPFRIDEEAGGDDDDEDDDYDDDDYDDEDYDDEESDVDGEEEAEDGDEKKPDGDTSPESNDPPTEAMGLIRLREPLGKRPLILERLSASCIELPDGACEGLDAGYPRRDFSRSRQLKALYATLGSKRNRWPNWSWFAVMRSTAAATGNLPTHSPNAACIMVDLRATVIQVVSEATVMLEHFHEDLAITLEQCSPSLRFVLGHSHGGLLPLIMW